MSIDRRPRTRGQLAAGLALAAAVAAISFSRVVAQAGPPAAPSRPYKAPRTADGQPDLQGYWTNLTYTPFERPKELGDKAFYTEQEALDAFNKAAQVSLTTDQLVHYVQSDFGS